jgi:hypothetical protein
MQIVQVAPGFNICNGSIKNVWAWFDSTNQLSIDEDALCLVLIHKVPWLHVATYVVSSEVTAKNGMIHTMWHTHHTCNLISCEPLVLLDNLSHMGNGIHIFSWPSLMDYP